MALFCRRITVCSSYQWTWMSGSVLCFDETEPWIHLTPSARRAPGDGAGVKSIGSTVGAIGAPRLWDCQRYRCRTGGSAACPPHSAGSVEQFVYGTHDVVDGGHASSQGEVVGVDDESRSDGIADAAPRIADQQELSGIGLGLSRSPDHGRLAERPDASGERDDDIGSHQVPEPCGVVCGPTQFCVARVGG